jgi:hypothetical protein
VTLVGYRRLLRELCINVTEDHLDVATITMTIQACHLLPGESEDAARFRTITGIQTHPEVAKVSIESLSGVSICEYWNEISNTIQVSVEVKASSVRSAHTGTDPDSGKRILGKRGRRLVERARCGG